MSNFGIRLMQARKRAGLSRCKLADLVALSNSDIKKYEAGDAYPSSDIALILAKALKVRVDFFFRPVRVVLENVRFRVR